MPISKFSNPMSAATWLFLCLACVVGSAAAQDEDDVPEAPAAPARAARPAKPDKDAPPPLNLRLEDPAIRSVMESNPTTPADIVRAADVLVDLSRPELAKPLLRKLLDGKPDAQTLFELVERFGSAQFLKFARNPGLAPEGSELADAALSASQEVRTNPARLDKLVAALSSADENVRAEAVYELRRAHEAAIVALVKALGDPKRAAQHPAVSQMLARLGVESIGPLSAALDSQNAGLKARVIPILVRLDARSVLPKLLQPALGATSTPELKTAAGTALARFTGRVPSVDDASQLLSRHAHQALEQVRAERHVAEPTAEVWRWDEKTGQSALVHVPPADAAALDATRAAADAYVLTPDAETRRLFVIAQLTAAKLLGGLDHPLASGEGSVRAQAAGFGPTVVEEVLLQSLAEGQFAAATAAAEVLGDIGNEEILHRSGNALSPLAEAARSNDRRLRFAAVEAICKLKPTRSFAGASSVPQMLGWFAGTTGFRKALVGDPRSHRSQRQVGLLAGMDYEGEQATSSRQFMEMATNSPDYELGLVHMSLQGPPVDDLLSRLRRDPRTADLPIGLIAPAESVAAAERLAARVPRVVVIPPVQDEAALKFHIDRLLDTTGRDLVSAAERQAQAATALDWLARLTDGPQRPFDLQQVEPMVARALDVPAISRQAALVISNLPTAAGQRSLAELAGRTVLPIEVRQAAAIAFRRSVRQHGLLLTSTELLDQYGRYNNSRGQDTATQQVFASVLDTIEGKDEAQPESAGEQPEPSNTQPSPPQPTKP